MTDPLIKAIGLFPELAGETVPEQVHCCMRVLHEFQQCSVETDGVQLLRTKFLGDHTVALLGWAGLGMRNKWGVWACLGIPATI